MTDPTDPAPKPTARRARAAAAPPAEGAITAPAAPRRAPARRPTKAAAAATGTEVTGALDGAGPTRRPPARRATKAAAPAPVAAEPVAVVDPGAPEPAAPEPVAPEPVAPQPLAVEGAAPGALVVVVAAAKSKAESKAKAGPTSMAATKGAKSKSDGSKSNGSKADGSKADGSKKKSGAAAVAAEIADLLVAAEPAPPVIPAPPKVRPKDPARLAVQRHLATHAAALLEQEARVRADAHDSVHKMRVAARRLRSGLRTFRPLVDADWARGLADELRWLASSLGEMRDREVLLVRLERDIAALPAWAASELTLVAVRTELGKKMDAARGDALAALDSPRYTALIASLAEAAGDPPTTAAAERPCTKALPPLVTKAFKKLADEASHLHLDPPQVAVTAESDAAWHEARITAKKARYAAEACEPIFGKPATALAAKLTLVTETLGEHQDAAVAAEAVIEIGELPGVPSAAALTLGVLHGVQREAVRAARAEFVAVWPEVSDKRWRAWL